MKPSDLGFCTCQDWYDPCHVGVHVCGYRVCNKHSAPDEVPVTEVSIPCANGAAARSLFERLKSEFAEADGDLLVDLVERGDINDDFWISRQMLDRLKAASGIAGTK